MSAPVRTGIGFDSHRLEAGRRLILGGVEIEESGAGLAGHSDADVLTHAVIDALLGAAGLGDIGQHFPDTDERWKDANSLDLLRRVRELLHAERYEISNIDATVACESPQLGPYRDEMRSRMAEVAGVESTAVNVKFTTGERMGFVGRGEGIVALAVANVVRGGAAAHG